MWLLPLCIKSLLSVILPLLGKFWPSELTVKLYLGLLQVSREFWCYVILRRISVWEQIPSNEKKHWKSFSGASEFCIRVKPIVFITLFALTSCCLSICKLDWIHWGRSCWNIEITSYSLWMGAHSGERLQAALPPPAGILAPVIRSSHCVQCQL